MGRNIRIVVVLLGLTIAVHILIFHKESSHHAENVIKVGTHISENLHGNHTTVPVPVPSKQTDARGYGMLYKEIRDLEASFVQGPPKQLVILGYQRVGSSFFGEIFDKNDNFFYIYEPLDAVYAEMYGTQGGMNVPSDITYWANGTARDVPQDEKDAVSKLLSDILGCHVSSLPQGFLLHKYWYFLVDAYMPSWHDYRSCFKRHQILKAREECASRHLAKLCPNRFNMNVTAQDKCKENLARTLPSDDGPFGSYKQCLGKAFTTAGPCIKMYEHKCKKARLFATKTVRGMMDELDVLMENNPNMRIIHLIRDPRAVVVSRRTEFSYRGLYSGNITQKHAGDMVKESHLYCGTVVRDIKHRQVLAEQYPGRVTQVIYEDFVQNPQEYVKAIYKFLDESIPQSILTWIRRNTQGTMTKNNAMKRMSAWRSKMTYAEGERIQAECSELYQMLNYRWPYNAFS